MKEKGYAFEIGYYYAVGLVIFAIVIFYSVHFPPVCFAGLLYFNCKHFVDKYNLLYVYPVNCSDHVRSGGQMGGTVHDMVLFSLCLMQLGSKHTPDPPLCAMHATWHALAVVCESTNASDKLIVCRSGGVLQSERP